MTNTQGTATVTSGATSGPVVIIGGAGKTGHRVADRLARRGIRTRFASRSTDPQFDWNTPQTWGPALAGADGAYIAYQPDLAVPGAADTIRQLAMLAAQAGVARLVLLSGRGEPGAQAAERAAFESHPQVTVCRVAWFAQNFTEGMLAGAVPTGVVTLPAPADVAEPFVDLDDVADVAVVALTEDDQAGRVHELTGPQALTMSGAATIIGQAAGHPVEFVQSSAPEFVAAAMADGLDEPSARFLAELFADILDGRNVATTNGVRDALGREPKSLHQWAHEVAAQGVWAVRR